MKTINQTSLLKHAFLAVCGFIAAAVTAFADPACVLPTRAQQPFVPPIRIQLPDGTNGIQINSTGNPASYVTITLKNVPPGFSVTNGTYRAWCVDATGALCPREVPNCLNSIHKPILFDSDDGASLAAAGLPTANWDKINYIINNKPLWAGLGYNVSEIQAAIWRFIGFNAAEEASILGGSYFGFPAGSVADVNAMVATVNANGTGFTPGPGQLTAVVVQLPAALQDEVAFEDLFKEGQLTFIEVLCTPPGSIGDTVFCDLNENGTQDPGEPGIPNVQVNLVCGPVNLTTFTNANGNYLFTNLAPGTCTVSVNTATLPPDCNKIIPGCPTSITMTLLPGQNRLDADFCFGKAPGKCLFLVIDEDTIDNTSPAYYLPPNTGKGVNGRTWSASDVNDDRPRLAQRTPLRFFNNPANFGRQIVIRSGQVGDEGMFAPKVIPSSWVTAGPTLNGLKNYIGNPCLPYPHNVGKGLGTGSDPESRLDKIPKVTPLRAQGLKGLIGRTVCAVVYDSDISINYAPLNGSLKGETLGVVAFKVLEVKQAIGFSSSTLPLVTIEIVDPCKAFEDDQELYLSAPEPTTSSTPFDIKP